MIDAAVPVRPAGDHGRQRKRRADPHRHTLDRKRVFIFPTRHGLMLGAMMLVVLLGSINYDNALGYLLTFLLFGLFLIAMLHTYRNLAGLSYLGAEAKPVFAGASARFELAFDNRGQWPRYALELAPWPRRGQRWRRRRRASAVSRIELLPAIDVAPAAISLPAPRRGWLPLQRFRITSTFPLGILRAWAYFEDDTNCLVYPQPQGHHPLPARGASSEGIRAGTSQGDDDFAGFRPYRPGDPVRAIAWKSLARQETILVKRFTSGAARRVWLRWADCAALAGTEARLSQLTQWVIEAERLGLQYGLDLPPQRVEPASGSAHRHQCLRVLALHDRP